MWRTLDELPEAMDDRERLWERVRDIRADDYVDIYFWVKSFEFFL